jgi:radical SAM superfamily enzyme YgiQ (UPF0313 family)
MDKEILLLFPPFTSRKNPYLSLPVLSRYLKDRNVPVSVEDIGIKFWNRFMDTSKLKEAKFYIESNFLKLNEKKKLNFMEIVEYVRLSKLLNTYPYFSQLPDTLLLNILMSPYFPDIYLEVPINRLFSPFDEFSSIDIVNSLKYNFFYSHIIEEIVKKIFFKRNPLLVAISLIFQNQVLPAFYIASLIKKYSPQTYVAIGGPFVSLHFNEIENKDLFNIVDSFILDEGELPLEKLYYELQKDNPILSEIPNLVWCDGKKIIKNKTAPPLTLDKLTCPDYGVMPLDEYQEDREKMIYSFRLSRGCYWQQCSFCRTDIFFCKNYAQPEYKSVFEALLEAYEKYRAKRFLFSDESAHPNLLEYISKKILEHKLDISWFTHSRFHESLNREKFELFKKANCSYISLGLESYNDRILKLMKKGITVKLINKVINENNGLLPLKVYMIVGFPTETEEEALNGFSKINGFYKNKKIISHIYSFFQLNYGSDMWHNYKNYGIRKINIKDNQDLLPDIFDIECEGMSRKLANEFYLKFSENSNNTILFDSVIVDNRRIKLNYNILNLVNIIKKESFCSTVYPFRIWLENTNITVRKNGN